MTEPEASQSWTTDEEDFESASEGGNDDQRGQDDDMGENEEDVADVRDVLTAARAVPAATIATALAGARAETKGVANTSVKADEDAHARARDVRDARRTDKNVEELAHERGTGVESAATSAAPAPASAWSWGGFLTSAVSAVAESLTADVDSLVGTAKNVGEGLKKATVESVDRVYGTLDPAFASGNGEVRSPMAVSTAIAEEPDVAATAVSTEQHSPRFVCICSLGI